MRVSGMMGALAVCSVLAACQTTAPTEQSLSRDPFARTRQPVPEVPQFRNGKPTDTKDASADAAATPASPAKPASNRKVVESTVKKSEMPGNFAAGNVVDVRVDSSNADKGFGWAFTIDKAKAARIADQAITAELEAVDNDKGQPIVVHVHFNMLYLAGGAGALLGSTNSAARVSFFVTDRNDNRLAPGGGRVNAAGSRRLGGLLGAAQVKSQDEEMALVARGVGAELKKALFGK